MAVKKIRSITVQFEGARVSEEYWPSEDAELNFAIDDETGALAIHETDEDEQRALTIYARGGWAAVHLAWEDQESQEVKYVRNPNPSSHSADVVVVDGKAHLQIPGTSGTVPMASVTDSELENYYGWKRV